jgi:hypothetical protein
MGRRVSAIAALAVMTLGLTACVHDKAGGPDYRWTYLNDADEAPRLAYGRPASDDVVVMLSCSPGADSVRISATGLEGGEIVLASDRSESRFPAAKVDNAMVETGLLEARGKMSAPALSGFQLTGELALLTNGERHRLNAVREDRGQVKAFFRRCAA